MQARQLSHLTKCWSKHVGTVAQKEMFDETAFGMVSVPRREDSKKPDDV